MPKSDQHASIFKRSLVYGLSLLLIWQPILVSAADAISPTHSTDGRPTLDHAANGVPIVNIQNPNGQGVSQNFYNDLNVSSQGLILNNSRQLTQTQLGGYIEGNPNLTNGSASLILNEVIGSNPSSLKGYMEVGGARADVVVANPNGITCNGCGFINTNHATLTTGTAIMEGGRLRGFDVQGGNISIVENGLNASNVDRFDLIARSVEVAGELHADRLNIVTGQQTVNRNTLETSNVTTDADKPAFAIDSTALGGMYANRIRLIANEDGVGVRLNAPVAAQNGNLTLSANGQIEHSDLAATGDITIDANQHDVTGLGNVQSLANITIDAADYNNQGGAVVAERRVVIGADNLTNTGTIGGRERLFITADSILNDESGALLSNEKIVLSADKITNRLADIYSTEDVIIRGKDGGTADSLENRSGRIEALNDLTIDAAETSNVRDFLDWEDVLTGGVATYECIECAHTNYTMLYKFTEQFMRELDPATTDRSLMVAGRNLSLTGQSLLNETSDIIAFNNMVLDLDTIENFGLHSGEYTLVNYYKGDMYYRVHRENVLAGVEVYNTRNYFGQAVYWSDGGTKGLEYMGLEPASSNSSYDPDNFLSRQDNLVHNRVTHIDEDIRILESTDILGANIVAGNDLNMDGADIKNGDIGTRLEPDVSEADLIAVGEGSGSASRYDDYLTGVNGGLFSIADPDHPYLIETNPFFATMNGLLGSEYMLAKLNWDPDGAIRLLGDGYYEQQLIRQQIIDLTGRVLLSDNYKTANQQYRQLLENGVFASESLELAVGVALTPEQINKLTKDIVWLVEQEVAGETVLVPQLYLSPSSIVVEGDGALIAAGGKMTIDDGSILNTGTFYFGGNAYFGLNENGLVNLDGVIKGDGVLRIDSEGEVRNVSGIIEARKVAIKSAQDIINIRYSRMNEMSDGSWREWNTDIGQAGVISGLNKLVLDAEGDIKLAGASLEGGKLKLNADGNIVIDTIAIKEGREGSFHGGQLTESSVQHLGSEVNATLSLLAKAGNDFSLIGSSLNSDKGIKLAAGNDMLIASAANSSTYDFRVRHDGETSHNIQRSVRHQGSEINGGGNIKLSSGNNLTAIASSLKSDKNLSLKAKGDMALLAANDSDYRYSYEEEDKWYVSTTTIEEEYEERANVTELSAGGNVLINAGKNGSTGRTKAWKKAEGNVLLEGTSIDAGKNAVVYAGEDLLVTAAETQSFQRREVQREYTGLAKGAMAATSLLASGMLTSALVPDGVMDKLGGGQISLKGNEGEGSSSTQLARADISAEGNAVLLSGKDTTLVAADLFLDNLKVKAGLNGEKESGNIALIGAHETNNNWSYESSTSIGMDISGGSMSFARQSEHRESQQAINYVGTDVSSLGNARLTSRGDMVLVGSSLNSEGNVRLAAGGDISMLAGVNSQSSSVSDVERDFKIEASASGSSAELFAGYEESRHEQIEQHRTAVGSEINGSNITLSSGKDIAVVGGVLQASTSRETGAGGNLTLKADGSIATLASVSDSMLRTIDENLRMGVAVGARENVTAASDAVNNVGNQQGALNTASATLQAVDSVQGARSGGVSASVGLVAEWSKQESEDTSQTANSTLIVADNDLAFISGGDQRHVGTQALAGNNLEVDAGGNVTIESAQNTMGHQDKSTNASINIGLGSESGASVTVAGGYANNRSQQVQQVNAHFSAGNTATVNTQDDLTLAGAVISARNIDADIGGSLTVESRQDTGYTRGESAQGSVTVGTGPMGLNLSGSHTEGESAWVYEQSGMLASNTADVYVEDHMSLVGGVINSDTGDLSLDTGTFSYQDVRDYDHFESMSLGFGIGVPQGQAGTKPDTANEESRLPGVDMNNFTAGYQNQEREQATRATVGEGSVTVRADQQSNENSLAGLNRDMSLAQEITRDEEDNYNLYVSDTSLEGLGVLDRDENDKNSRLDQLKDTLNLNLIVSETGESFVAGIDSVDNALADGITLGQLDPEMASRGVLNDQMVNDYSGVVGDAILSASQLLLNRDDKGGWHFIGLGQSNDLLGHYERNQLARLKIRLARELKRAEEEGELEDEKDLVDLVNNITDNDAGLTAEVLASLASEIADKELEAGLYEQEGSGLAGAAEGVHDESRDYLGINIDRVNIRDAREVMSVLGEESYHARDDANDHYANLFGDRFGYLWDKANRLEGRQTGGGTSVEQWRSISGNAARLAGSSRQLAVADPLSLEFRQFKSKEASTLDHARYVVANEVGLSEQQKRDYLLRLEAKACAAVRCANGLPDDDQYRDVLVALQEYGQQLTEDEGGINSDLEALGVQTVYEWRNGRSRGTTELFDYVELDDRATDAASKYTDEAVNTVNTKVDGGYQLAVGVLAADAAAVSGSEDMAGFAEHQFATADEMFGKEYQSQVGERVLNSMSAETFEEAPSYVGDSLLLGVEAIPAAAAVKKSGAAIKKAKVALNELTDAAKQLVAGRRAASAAGKSDELAQGLEFDRADNSTIQRDSKSSIEPISVTARDEYTGLYDPNRTRADLEAVHGAENVNSTTNPNKPLQSANSNPEKGIEVILGDDGGKAVALTYIDPASGLTKTANVPYNTRGLAVFDDYAEFTTNIDRNVSYTTQMKRATEDLKREMNAGRIDSSRFNEQQIQDIQNVRKKIEGYTWHHDPDKGAMQLIPTVVHDAAKHVGQKALSSGR